MAFGTKGEQEKSTSDRMKRLRSALSGAKPNETSEAGEKPDLGKGMIAAAMGAAKKTAAPEPEARTSLVRSMMADLERSEDKPAPAMSAVPVRRRASPSVGLNRPAPEPAQPRAPQPLREPVEERAPRSASKPRRASASVGLHRPPPLPDPEPFVEPPKERPAASPVSQPVRETVAPDQAPALSDVADETPSPAKADAPAERARRVAERLRQDPASTPSAAPDIPEAEEPVYEDVWTKRRAPLATPQPEPELRAEEAPPEQVTRAKLKPRELRTAKTRPFAKFEWDIASRYLRARRKEGFISVIAGFSLVGIALGVGTLIVVMAVMTGFRETLIDQILGVNPHINVVSQEQNFTNFDSLGEAIRQVEGVEGVWPSIEGQVLASSASGHSGVIVRGIRQSDLRRLKIVTEPEMSTGSVDDFRGDRGIAVGEGVARKLGLRIGESLTLITPDGDLTPFGITPRRKSYPIIYIYKLGLSNYDSAFVYMPLEEAQLYFNKKGQVDSLEVVVDDPNNVESFRTPIRQAARSSIGVYTWKDLQGGLIGALDIERRVMFIILTLIILVAALNIISGLVMLVKDKARDVAIMRTMGMSRGSVLRIFFMCGASIGVIGSIVGVVLGVLFTLNISTIQRFIENLTGAVLWDPDVRFLSEIPARLQSGDVLLTLGIALGLSFLATLYPAWRAAKLDPVEALRYE